MPRDIIYIYKTKKKKVRKGNSHLQEEERNVASIKYGPPEVLFCETYTAKFTLPSRAIFSKNRNGSTFWRE